MQSHSESLYQVHFQWAFVKWPLTIATKQQSMSSTAAIHVNIIYFSSANTIEWQLQQILVQPFQSPVSSNGFLSPPSPTMAATITSSRQSPSNHLDATAMTAATTTKQILSQQQHNDIELLTLLLQMPANVSYRLFSCHSLLIPPSCQTAELLPPQQQLPLFISTATTTPRYSLEDNR